MATKIRPVKRSSAAQKAKMKQSFKKWANSAAGRTYERIRKNPAAYRRHLLERITKVKGWIVKLRASKDPDKVRKIANHTIRLKSLQVTVSKLK